MFEQAKLTVENPKDFDRAKGALDEIFGASSIADYLARLKHSHLRVRDFESALGKGLLGKEIAEAYAALGSSDRGQVREIYLTRIEKVEPELRKKYLKLYAYY